MKKSKSLLIVRYLFALTIALSAMDVASAIQRDWIPVSSCPNAQYPEVCGGQILFVCIDKSSLRREGDLVRVWLKHIRSLSCESTEVPEQDEWLVRCSDERLANSESTAGNRVGPDKIYWWAARRTQIWQVLVDKVCELRAALPENPTPSTVIDETPRGSAAKTQVVTPRQQPAPSPPSRTAAPSDAERATTATSGTGFFVTGTGHILTNYHVAGDCRSLAVVYAGKEFKGRLLASDHVLDLALVKIDAKPETFAAFRSPPQVQQGESVLAVGYPLKGLLASGPIVSTGSVNALAGIANDSTKLQVSAPLQPGNSGGPLVDSAGNIVGVVVAKLNAVKVTQLTGDIPQNVNFAIKSEIARTFLEANQVEAKYGHEKSSKDPTQVASLVRSYAVPIECVK